MTDREKFEAAMLKAENGYTLNGRFECVEMWDADTLYGVWQESRRQALEEAIAICDKKAVAFDSARESAAAYGCDICSGTIATLASPEGEQV